jgi:cytoskeletal protein CcmA (bactofilin family)
MDPSQVQSDKDNDTNSLENSGTTVEGEKPNKDENSLESESPTSTSGGSDNERAVDARDSAPVAAAPVSDKQSFFKRFWQKFNIYLLLFILIILVAIGLTIGMFFKNRNDTKKTESVINSQNLSDSALKQLANSDVTVGNSKQVLKVESNALFSGSVLVRGDLEVAGSVKVGNELQLPGITVSGSSRFNQLQADNLTIGSNATVQGTFNAKKGINVSGNSTFDGLLSAAQISTNTFILNGDLKLTHHITAGGPAPNLNRGGALGSGGTASVSGSDTTGSIIVNTGSSPGAGCFATVTFAKRFDGTPHVTITPIGSGAADINYYVNRSSTEFSVCTTNPAPSGQSFGFDYIILN